MRTFTRLIGFVTLASCASGSLAAEIDLDILCNKKTDSGYSVDPAELIGAALTPFPYALFTRDDGEVSRAEIFQALVYARFCDPGPAGAEAEPALRKCTKDESRRLRNARNFIRGVADHQDVRIDPAANAPGTHEWFIQGLQPELHWAMLDDRRRFVVMRCQRPEPVTEEDAGDDKPKPQFLLTKNIDDLTLPRGGEGDLRRDRLKGVPQAEISYVDDNEGDTETFRVHGTAGVAFPLSPRGHLIPFVQFVRSRVEDSSGAEPATETSKLAIGMLSKWRVGRFDLVELTGLYSNDLEDGNEVIQASLGWRPGFLYRLRSFRAAWHFCRAEDRLEHGCAYGRTNGGIKTDFKMLATAGHVLDVGDDPLLVENRDYVRVGAEGRLTLFGTRGVVRDLSIDIGYRHLFGLAGDPDHLSRLTGGVNYWIAGSPHVSVRLGYERSRDEQTLKRVNQWSVALGARF